MKYNDFFDLVKIAYDKRANIKISGETKTPFKFLVVQQFHNRSYNNPIT